MGIRAMTLKQYNEYCSVYKKGVSDEGYTDEQVWDLAKNIVDCPSLADERAVEFLRSGGVKDLVGRLADDISIGHH